MTCYYNPDRAHRFSPLVVLLAALGLAAVQQASAVGPPSANAERLAYARVFSAKAPDGLGKSLDELETIARQSGTEEIVMFPRSAGPEAQVHRWIRRPGSQEYAYPGVAVKARTHLHKHKQAGTLQLSKDGKRATAVLAAQNAHLKWQLPESARAPLSCDIYENNKLLAKNTIYERLSPSGKQRWPQVIRIDVPHRDLSIIQVFEYLDERPDGLSSVREESGQDLPAEQPVAKSADSGDVEPFAASPADCNGSFKEDNVTFYASLTALPGLDWDTGWLPGGSPVQIRLDMGMGADISSSVSGKFEYCWEGGNIAYLATGSAYGHLAMDFGAEMSAEGRVKIDLGWYDADFTFDIPYTPNFDLRCEDSTPFYSYLLDSSATVRDDIDEQELYSASVAGIPSVADVSVGASAAMSLSGTLRADSISTFEGNSITSEGGSCSVMPDAGGDYSTTLSYDDELTMTVTVTFYPWICAGIDLWIYEWDYCVEVFELPWDVVSGELPLDFSDPNLDFEASYDLRLSHSWGGTLDPNCGFYPSDSNWCVDVSARPRTRYGPYYDSATHHYYWTYVEHALEYWQLDGENVGSANPYHVCMDDDHPFHSLRAVFFRPKASYLHPRHRLYDLDPNVVLSWLPGERAVSHDVYFGTDYNDVNDANTTDTTGIFRRNQVLADSNYIPPEDLEMCGRYYWRIDEVNESNIPRKGDVWYFTIVGCCASEPDPEDGAIDVPRDGLLSWTAGGGAGDVNGHDVYLGTDFDSVRSAWVSDTTGIYRGRTDVVKWVDPCDANIVRYKYDPPEALDILRTYYWRIDEVNEAEANNPPWTWIGDVWSFTVEGKAKNPYPADGAQDVPVDVVLTWTPGAGAADVNGHDVYFSTDFNDVNDANTSAAGVYKGRQDPCEYARPGNLLLNTTYYWRIDEVNDPCIWKGDVWSFTTANYLIVDDMESYDNTSNWIGNTWLDGVWNETGSWVDLGTEAFAPVNGGEQSMLYMYDNTFKWDHVSYLSEAELPFDSPQDWTEANVKVLTLFFYGDPDNEANATTEQMYVGLEDGNSYAQVEYGYYDDEDMNDLKKQQWQEWNIALDDFNDVNLAGVNKVYIAFGDRDNTTIQGGSGMVYFDDIRLYRRKCVASRLKPELDVTSDCVVGFGELEIMGQDWLDTDYEVIVEQPNDQYLLVHYVFDDHNDLNDVSGPPYYHGSPVNEPNVHNGMLTVDGNSFVDIPLGPNNPFNGSGDFSIVMEFRTLQPGILISSADPCEPSNPDNHSMSVFVHYWGEQNDQTVVYSNAPEGFGGAGAKDNPLDGQWHHVVTTYDANNQLHRVYLDGRPGWDDEFHPSIPHVEQNTARIGGSLNIEFPGEDIAGNFVGDVNSVRIYDCALTHGQVLSILGKPNGSYYMELDSPFNLVPKDPPGPPFDPDDLDIVDFRDFARLAESWREEKLWPPEP
jgi:hypothetical protein